MAEATPLDRRDGCGACTACCTLMRVEMEPPKPAWQTCSNCTAGGCSIYADRPAVCSGFMCLWLASQKMGAIVHGLQLPDAMRPDRCGMIIDLNGVGTVIAHCATRASWKRDPMRAWLLTAAAKAVVILEFESGAELLNADASTEALQKVGVDPVTNNRLYARVSELRAAHARLGLS